MDKDASPVACSGNIFTDASPYTKALAVLEQHIIKQEYAECLIAATELLRQYPQKIQTLNAIAIAALNLKQWDTAFASTQHALTINAEHVFSLMLLSDYFYKTRQFESAANTLKKLLKLAPLHTDAINLLSLVYHFSGNMLEALPIFEKNLELADTPRNQWNYALFLLANGLYEKGWQFYEARFALSSEMSNPLHLKTPRWDGKSDLENKTLLISSEQGLGDMIQMIRFVPMLKQHCSTVKVILVCHPALYSLFSQIKGIDTILKNTAQLIPPHDYFIGIASLPYYFHIHDESQFMSEPYLLAKTDIDFKKQWQINPDKKINIGIVWKGNKNYSFADSRDCDLRYFLTLLSLPNVGLYSLQKELTETEKNLLHYSGVADLGSQLKDLLDTANVIANLDLVATVDTAIGHLAGALGVPIWFILRFETEWRHPRNKDYSPWYKSAFLFRQPTPGNWQDVFIKICEKLERILNSASIVELSTRPRE